MDCKQGQRHDAPELVNENYPEAVPPHQQYLYDQYQYQYQYQHPPQNVPVLSPEDAAKYPSAYSSSQATAGSPYQLHSDPVAAGAAPTPRAAGKRKGTLFGCPVLEVILCAIIALLSAAVIGLAAGTGVEANRANEAEARAAQLRSSLASATAATSTTASSSTATSTSYSDLDEGCSSNPDGVTGKTYDAFSLLGNYTFTIECNKDAPGDPLMVLFSADIDTCMDACASYDAYSTASNSTCGAVSFIPLWTTKSDALKGGAPGNCYLKPAQAGALEDPNIGTECHAGVLTAS